MKMLNGMAAVLTALALAACGGGGGDKGTSPFGSGSGNSGGTTDGTSNDGATGVVGNSAGTVVVNIGPTNVISASAPGTVTALVKDAKGAPVVGTVVTFAVEGGLATVAPATVLTDSNGSAAAAIMPASSSAVGAGYVSASAETAAGILSKKVAFSVSSTSVALETLDVSPVPPLAAYSSAVLSVGVKGASSSSPVTVSFSSTCASSGKAVISPSILTLTGSAGTVTYQDKNCSGTDRISASIVGTSQQKTLDLTVSAPATRSIQFVSAAPETICLAGSGCPASSIVSFKVTDQFGNPVAGNAVDFALDIPGVAELSFPSGNTNAQGQVDVSVLSKTIPTPVRVKATVRGTALTTVSNALAINAGLPTQNAVSFSASVYNLDGWDRDGQTSTIRLQLNDRFANPVPDGTAVSFVAEGASVIPARCVTKDAVCTVSFVSSNFRPADGRVTVVAYAQGEESFSDLDRDNLYTSGEAFGDLGEVFVDDNENGSMDTGEYIAGSSPNGVWDGNTYVRSSRVFVLSASATAPRLFDVDGGGNCGTTEITGAKYFNFTLTPGGTCRASAQVCIRDANVNADGMGGNPLPSGATVSVTTQAKDASVKIDRSPIQSTALRPTVHTLTAELSDCSKAATRGDIDLQVQMPNSGPSYTFSSIGQIQ